jgi:hypothetical protein
MVLLKLICFLQSNGLVESLQSIFGFLQIAFTDVGSNAVLNGYTEVARKRIPSDCITLKTVANSGLPSIDKDL